MDRTKNDMKLAGRFAFCRGAREPCIRNFNAKSIIFSRFCVLLLAGWLNNRLMSNFWFLAKSTRRRALCSGVMRALGRWCWWNGGGQNALLQFGDWVYHYIMAWVNVFWIHLTGRGTVKKCSHLNLNYLKVIHFCQNIDLAVTKKLSFRANVYFSQDCLKEFKIWKNIEF